MVRMVRVLVLCTLMLATLLPVATAGATEDPAVAQPAASEAAVEEPAAPEPAVPEAPVVEPAAPPPAADEPEEPAEAPAAPVVETTEPPADVDDEPEDLGDAPTGEEPGEGPTEDADAPEDGDTATPAEAAEADPEDTIATAQAIAPADVVVVEFDAAGFCDLIVEEDGVADEASVEVAPAVAAAAPLPYADLVAQVDAVLAGYPDAMLVSASYDGSSLIVVLVPDISVCEGFDDEYLPVPVDDLDDVEVIVEVLPDEDVCLLLEEEFGEELLAAPSIEDFLASLEDEELADIARARFGPELSADELDQLLDLGGALDPVLAETPGGWVDVTYDGAVLLVFVTPDPATVDCGEDPVVAQPVGNPLPPAPPAGGGGAGKGAPVAATTAASGGRLAQTGFDTTEQAAAGLLAVLLGAVLLRRGRYRGLHAAG